MLAVEGCAVMEVADEEKALKAHVTARALLCWGLYLAQACLVGCKCLARVAVFAGSERDWAFWTVTALAAAAPLAETQALGALLGQALERRRAERGWATGESRKPREARLGDMMSLVLLDWHLVLLALSGLTVARCMAGLTLLMCDGSCSAARRKASVNRQR